MRVEIRRIQATDGTPLMQTRLLALLDAPYAFAATYVDEVQDPIELWNRRAARSAAGTAEAVFVAEIGEDWVGMVGGYTPDDAPVSRHLYGMWVAPEVRRQGLGVELTDTLCEWARISGAERVDLWVAEANDPAIALYEACGFVATGAAQPLPSDTTITEIAMSKRL